MMAFSISLLLSSFFSLVQLTITSTTNQPRWLETNARIINNCDETQYVWNPAWRAIGVLDSYNSVPDFIISPHAYHLTSLSSSGLNFFLVSEHLNDFSKSFKYVQWFANETITTAVQGPGPDDSQTRLETVHWTFGEETICPQWDDSLPEGGPTFCSHQSRYELRLCSTVANNKGIDGSTISQATDSKPSNPKSEPRSGVGSTEYISTFTVDRISHKALYPTPLQPTIDASDLEKLSTTASATISVENQTIDSEIPNSTAMVTFTPVANTQLSAVSVDKPKAELGMTTSKLSSTLPSIAVDHLTSSNSPLPVPRSSTKTQQADVNYGVGSPLKSKGSNKSKASLAKRETISSSRNATKVWFHNDCSNKRYLWIELDNPKETPIPFNPGEAASYEVNVKNPRYMMIWQSSSDTKGLDQSTLGDHGPLILNITSGITNFTAINWSRNASYTWTWTFGFEPWCESDRQKWNQSHVLCAGSDFYKISLCATNFPPNSTTLPNHGLSNALPSVEGNHLGPRPFNPYGPLLVNRSEPNRHTTNAASLTKRDAPVITLPPVSSSYNYSFKLQNDCNEKLIVWTSDESPLSAGQIPANSSLDRNMTATGGSKIFSFFRQRNETGVSNIGNVNVLFSDQQWQWSWWITRNGTKMGNPFFRSFPANKVAPCNLATNGSTKYGPVICNGTDFVTIRLCGSIDCDLRNYLKDLDSGTWVHEPCISDQSTIGNKTIDTEDTRPLPTIRSYTLTRSKTSTFNLSATPTGPLITASRLPSQTNFSSTTEALPNSTSSFSDLTDLILHPKDDITFPARVRVVNNCTAITYWQENPKVWGDTKRAINKNSSFVWGFHRSTFTIDAFLGHVPQFSNDSSSHAGFHLEVNHESVILDVSLAVAQSTSKQPSSAHAVFPLSRVANCPIVHESFYDGNWDFSTGTTICWDGYSFAVTACGPGGILQDQSEIINSVTLVTGTSVNNFGSSRSSLSTGSFAGASPAITTIAPISTSYKTQITSNGPAPLTSQKGQISVTIPQPIPNPTATAKEPSESQGTQGILASHSISSGIEIGTAQSSLVGQDGPQSTYDLQSNSLGIGAFTSKALSVSTTPGGTTQCDGHHQPTLITQGAGSLSSPLNDQSQTPQPTLISQPVLSASSNSAIGQPVSIGLHTAESPNLPEQSGQLVSSVTTPIPPNQSGVVQSLPAHATSIRPSAATSSSQGVKGSTNMAKSDQVTQSLATISQPSTANPKDSTFVAISRSGQAATSPQVATASKTTSASRASASDDHMVTLTLSKSNTSSTASDHMVSLSLPSVSKVSTTIDTHSTPDPTTLPAPTVTQNDFKLPVTKRALQVPEPTLAPREVDPPGNVPESLRSLLSGPSSSVLKSTSTAATPRTTVKPQKLLSGGPALPQGALDVPLTAPPIVPLSTTPNGDPNAYDYEITLAGDQPADHPLCWRPNQGGPWKGKYAACTGPFNTGM